MMNSVTLRAPRCSVSDRFQIRPRTSLGSLAFSKISFAFSPGCGQQTSIPAAVAVAVAVAAESRVCGCTYQTARHSRRPTSRRGQRIRRLWRGSAEAPGWAPGRWSEAAAALCRCLYRCLCLYLCLWSGERSPGDPGALRAGQPVR
jgi:hypothetical protein